MLGCLLLHKASRSTYHVWYIPSCWNVKGWEARISHWWKTLLWSCLRLQVVIILLCETMAPNPALDHGAGAVAQGDYPCPRRLQLALMGASGPQQCNFKPLFLAAADVSMEKGITLSRGEGRSRTSDHGENITQLSYRVSCLLVFWQPKLRQ